MSDLIFWYTGAAVWTVIALVFACALLIAAIAGCVRAYRKAGLWFQLIWIGRADMEQVDAATKAAANRGLRCGQPSAEWLTSFREHMRKQK